MIQWAPSAAQSMQVPEKHPVWNQVHHKKGSRQLPKAKKAKPDEQQYVYETGDGLLARFVDVWYYQNCSGSVSDAMDGLVVVDPSSAPTEEVLAKNRKVPPHPETPSQPARRKLRGG